MLILGFVIAMVGLAIGSPIFVAFSIGSSIVILLSFGMPLEAIAQAFFQGMNRFGLLAVPFFILAGKLMERGGVATIICDTANSILGSIRGGMGIALTWASAFFGSISGSNLATAVTIGGTMVPEMTRFGYPKRFGAAITGGSMSLGEFIPPSIAAILFGYVTGDSVGKLFMAGLLPGILGGALLCIPTVVISKRRGYGTKRTTSWMERRRIWVRAIPTAMLPLVVLGGIYTGVFTATEAAAIACLVAVVIGFLFHRKLTISNTWEATKQAISISGNIFFMIGGSSLLAMAFTAAQIPQNLTRIFLAGGLTPLTFSILCFIILIILGTFLDPAPMLLVSLPIFMPTMEALHIDHYVFYVMYVAATGIAQMSPPDAIVLYVLSSLLDEPPMAVFKEAIPWMLVYLAVVVIVFLVPQIANYIPSRM
jgi:C4-dicarboxylate transporter DctM subunit